MEDPSPPNFAPPPPPTPGARRLRSRRSRLWVVPWAAALLALVAGATRLFVVDPAYPFVVLNMLLPWLALSAAVSFVLSFFGRQGVLILFALPGALLASWPVVQERWPEKATYPQGLPLRLLTANLYIGNAHHEATIASLLEANADVLCLQEVNLGWAVSLEAEALMAAYPHRHVQPEDSPFGIAILSRLPLADVGSYPAGDLPQLHATVDVEGTAVEIHCVHLMPPLTPDLYAVHRRGGDDLLEMVRNRPVDASPLVLAGDFNSTPYNALHRELTATLEDAWIPGEDGFGHTAPAAPSPIPLLRVDHVYLGSGARSMGGRVPGAGGSDHRPVVVDLAIPRPGSGLAPAPEEAEEPGDAD